MNVLLSANAMMNNASKTQSGAWNFAIFQNGAEVGMSMGTTLLSSASNYAKAIATKLISVKSGDYFQIAIYGRVSDILSNATSRTYITLVEI